MGVTTTSAAIHITPVVFRTFFRHQKRKAHKYTNSDDKEEARDDIFFDEAFNIVKAFIKLGTKNTVESLQAFTNTHVPAPYWAAVAPVRIPLSVCNQAADVLIDWFGPEELKHVVGGERWWQVRGLEGVDGEWITEKEYLSQDTIAEDRKLSGSEQLIPQMEHLETVMLYVHGGGYFWGSINTHRYQIIHYARKIKGRAFAVNYRKAPQYPWPCPVQDVIASYLYLIQPPPNALHKPISPSKIVFAGDSAGGSLCLTALTVLRDMGLPMPAGAVLISPWVDLTHSFPSVMHNADSDIIPEYGFLAKPSALWPIDLIPPVEGRVGPTKSSPPPKPGHSDTLYPSTSRIAEDLQMDGAMDNIKSQDEMLQQSEDKTELSSQSSKERETQAKPFSNGYTRDVQDSGSTTPVHNDTVSKGSDTIASKYEIDLWEPKPPKVLMEDSQAVPLELRSQIQLYATTEQLAHPLVSPILQGSLGNLPPLYIIAGDAEVLRDEIMYLAHRAAYPERYPTRLGVLREGNRQDENARKFTTPTKVHLQVFDGMCHVLPVFIFTESAKYAYRSIAEFVKHITSDAATHEPFPELLRPPSMTSVDSEAMEEHKRHKSKFSLRKKSSKPVTEHSPASEATDVKLYNAEVLAVAGQLDNANTESAVENERLVTESTNADGAFIMIRERVDIHGHTRPMEPIEDISCLKLKPEQIGLIKEAPALRWLDGQTKWDKLFKKQAKKASNSRRKIEAKTQKMLDSARDQGLLLVHEPEPDLMQRAKSHNATNDVSNSEVLVDGTIQQDRRWGPLDLDHERPPPSAIAKRRDTPEALALLKKHIYHSAPITHRTVPKLKASDAVRAAFDPHDDPLRPPKQSVSEQQVKASIIPMHGVKMWDAITRYFMKENSKKAARFVKNTGERVGILEERRTAKDAR